MTIRRMLYFLRQALRNMNDNRLVHLLGLGTTVACLLIFALFLLLYVNVHHWFEGWGETSAMSVYLKPDITPYQQDKIYTALKNLPHARIRAFVSQDEAMEELKRILGPQSGFLDHFQKNPLPPSYEVTLVGEGPDDPEALETRLATLEGVQDIQSTRHLRGRLEGVLRITRLIGLTVGGLLCLCIVFIVFNTTKLTIYSRREDIEIFKLVGATDWFVKAPFLLEGAIQGIVGGLLTLFLLFVGYLFIFAKHIDLFGVLFLRFQFLPPTVIAGLLGLSVTLGIVGSLVALGRFFEV